MIGYTFRNLSFTILSLSLSHSAPAFAQAGSVNGPDMHGVAIPRIAEGEYPIEQFQHALSKCYKEAAGEILGRMILRKGGVNLQNVVGTRGIPSFVFKPYYLKGDPTNNTKRAVFETNTYLMSSESSSNNLVLRPTDGFRYRPKYPVEGNTEGFYNFYASIDNHSSSWTGGPALELDYSYVRTDSSRNAMADRASLTWLILDAPQPEAQVIDRSIYDDGGARVGKPLIVVKNPKFGDDRDAMNRGADLERLIIMSKTETSDSTLESGERTLKLTYNFKPVINCVKNEMARTWDPEHP